jgi:hypothetical protein
MNLKGLVARIRTEFLSDDVGDESSYLWKTPAIVSALGLAERDLARKLYLLADSITPEVCRFSVVAALGVFPRAYAIDDRILRIERMKFPGVTTPLIRKTTEWLDQNDPGWDEAIGTPSHFVADTDNFTVTFNRQPVTGGTVQMNVKRLPLVRLTSSSADLAKSLEVKQLDDELIHGALKYLYLRPDIEGYDAALSKKWENQFETDISVIIQNQAAMNPKEYVCKPERF